MEVNFINILCVGIGAIVIGMSKGGVKGIFILAVTMMALVYGAKASTGIIVPLLIFGDIFAVIYYRRHVKWNLLIKFLPWMLGGVLIGVFFGKDLSDEAFKKVMALVILFSVFMMLVSEQKKELILSDNTFFSFFMGLMAGITTMIGNLAGAFSNIYFLSSRIPKKEFIGTAAWLYFVINLFKLPFHVMVWRTINVQSLLVDLYLLPVVCFGFFLGVRIIKLFAEQFFRKFILAATAIGAVILLIN